MGTPAYPAGDDEPRLLPKSWGRGRRTRPGEHAPGIVLIERLGAARAENNRGAGLDRWPRGPHPVGGSSVALRPSADAPPRRRKSTRRLRTRSSRPAQLTDTPRAALETTRGGAMYVRCAKGRVRGGWSSWTRSTAQARRSTSPVAELMVDQSVRRVGVDLASGLSSPSLYQGRRTAGRLRKATDSFASSARSVSERSSQRLVTIASGGKRGPVRSARLSGSGALLLRHRVRRPVTTRRGPCSRMPVPASIEGIAAADGACSRPDRRGATMGGSAGRAAATVGAHACLPGTVDWVASIAEQRSMARSAGRWRAIPDRGR